VQYAGGGGGGGTIQSASRGVGGYGGGNGGDPNLSVQAQNGTANTGGGGGGTANGAYNTPSTGGSGVVILAYPDTFADLTAVSGGLTYTGPTTAGGNKIYRFTAGTGTITV
jgi:hypothetical protein